MFRAAAVDGSRPGQSSRSESGPGGIAGGRRWGASARSTWNPPRTQAARDLVDLSVLPPRANTVGLRLNGKGRKLLKKKHLLRIRLTMRLNLLDDHAWSGQRLILRRAGQGEVSSRPASRASIASDEPSMGMSSPRSPSG